MMRVKTEERGKELEVTRNLEDTTWSHTTAEGAHPAPPTNPSPIPAHPRTARAHARAHAAFFA